MTHNPPRALALERSQANRRAFLDAIAWAEGTRLGQHPLTRCDGYDVIVTGVEGPEIFPDFSRHPFALGRPPKVINSSGLRSTASGRYQFLLRHWSHYRALLRLPDFGAASQDAWALQLIRERGALPLVEAGHFAPAAARCANLWASLPGAGYGQPERRLEALQAAFVKAGGVLA